jgi:hypothetical protein
MKLPAHLNYFLICAGVQSTHYPTFSYTVSQPRLRLQGTGAYEIRVREQYGNKYNILHAEQASQRHRRLSLFLRGMQ